MYSRHDRPQNPDMMLLKTTKTPQEIELLECIIQFFASYLTTSIIGTFVKTPLEYIKKPLEYI